MKLTLARPGTLLLTVCDELRGSMGERAYKEWEMSLVEAA